MNSVNKNILRWVGIGVVSLCYYIALVASTSSFSAFGEKESMLFSGPISLEEHQASINSIMQATDDVFSVAVYGFLICVPIILLIFKKVR